MHKQQPNQVSSNTFIVRLLLSVMSNEKWHTNIYGMTQKFTTGTFIQYAIYQKHSSKPKKRPNQRKKRITMAKNVKQKLAKNAKSSILPVEPVVLVTVVLAPVVLAPICLARIVGVVRRSSTVLNQTTRAGTCS